MGKKTIVFYATNARNVKGKIVSITKIVKDCGVDFAVISELSTVNPPSIQNYTYCHALGEKKFRGAAIYVPNKWWKNLTKIPDDEKEEQLEMVQ